MNKLISLLNRDQLTVIVHCPVASIEFAQAAVAGGCDAVIFDLSAVIDDKDAALKILKTIKVPAGVSCSSDKITEEQIKELFKMGFSFIEICISVVPAWLNKIGDMAKIVTLDAEYSAYDLTELAGEGLDAIDAAVVSAENLGKDLNVGDLQNYITVALSTGLPVIVPTQKLVRVSEVPIIWDTGAKGLILNKIVVGDTPLTVRSVTKEFSEAAAKLKEE
jgi:hypothetical protein